MSFNKRLAALIFASFCGTSYYVQCHCFMFDSHADGYGIIETTLYKNDVVSLHSDANSRLIAQKTVLIVTKLVP